MLDPVYAVEVEPGLYAQTEDRVMKPSRCPWIFNFGVDALDARDRYIEAGYLHARVVNFTLVEVRDGDDE